MRDTVHVNTPRFDTAAQLRQACRQGRFDAPTSGLAEGFQQGNIVILPSAYADDFLRFCVRNPKPAPILAVSEAGDPKMPSLGADLDIRHDVPRYRVFRDGVAVDTVTDLGALWRGDFVTFVLGCSFSFETALMRADIPVRHIEAGRNVAMYETNIQTIPAGPFTGPLVVSMRSFAPQDAIRAVILSSHLPQAHGAPVHIGDPAQIGIADLAKPDFGDAPVIRPGDVAVFWACGVTPQTAIRHARPEIAITHAPGHMLVTDLRTEIA
ncbi:putative hydro-lyase [Mesorhizobium sp. YIM 152430]|uniref:putative hydro-lyase n=1 Tax=Mesorhizobium sp. YIM 152430 TaxID=3031761 RepID=UPI0023D9A58B|nr:putative hydro-lyase [Mesorhizobium sp. YIM 152430]MDF1598941.1 putative hydro-lyase [Mesorhizobium sp. YIM 152430]